MEKIDFSALLRPGYCQLGRQASLYVAVLEQFVQSLDPDGAAAGFARGPHDLIRKRNDRRLGIVDAVEAERLAHGRLETAGGLAAFCRHGHGVPELLHGFGVR